MPDTLTRFNFQVQPDAGGARLDHFLVLQIADLSRSSLGSHIRSGHILVNNLRVKPGYRIRPGDDILVELPPPPVSDFAAQPVDFEVLFEDGHLLALSKPPGLVVHPAAGHADNTLVNGLLYRYGKLPGMENRRPGIVHRLDKDTSGVMVVAKTEQTQHLLSEAFKNRKIVKVYHALLLRSPKEAEGRIEAPLGRHPVNRKKRAIRSRGGRYAATSWRIVERFSCGVCLAEIHIETGRTHQIRVHMSSLGAPVAGDDLYGGKVYAIEGIMVNRQLLHASSLSLVHPITGRRLLFTAPLWPDMEQILERLRTDCSIEE